VDFFENRNSIKRASSVRYAGDGVLSRKKMPLFSVVRCQIERQKVVAIFARYMHPYFPDIMGEPILQAKLNIMGTLS
jgi:hypothetical protein